MEKRGGGELAELKKELRTLAASRSKEDVATKRELFKRIISYMGLSIDVSALFTEMTMATATADVATKKMLYHYITHHAHHHPVRPTPSTLQTLGGASRPPLSLPSETHPQPY